MVLPLLGAVVGAAGSVYAANEQKKNSRRAQVLANQQQIAAEKRAVNYANSSFNKQNAAAIAAANVANQRLIEAENRAAARDAAKIQTLVKDARAAGIHPLAAMGVSYGGPTAQAIGAATPSMPSVDFQAPQTSVPNNGDGIGDALAKIGIGIAEMQNMRLVEAQIRNMDAQTASTLMDARSRTAIANARLNGQSLFAGTTIKHNPNTDDAQDASQRYGEPGDFLFGLYNLFNDTNPLPSAKMNSAYGAGWDFGQWIRSWF